MAPYPSPLVLLFLSAAFISLLWHPFGPLAAIEQLEPLGSFYSCMRTEGCTKIKSSGCLDGKVGDAASKAPPADDPTSRKRFSALSGTSHLATNSTLCIRPHSKLSFQNQAVHRVARRKRAGIATASWSLVQRGYTGVSAQQITVVGDKYALIIDKVEHNPLKINGTPAWAALYNLETNEVVPLSLKTNSFCAGGSFLSNGTLLSLGGNAPEFQQGEFGDANGLQSIRFYTPCDDGKCAINEYGNIKMTSARWYPTSIRLPDGSVMIVGGSTEGAFRNSARINNPTIEYYPPKKLGFTGKWPIFSPFLNRTLITNLFPIVIALPTPDVVFMAANNDAMLYNWKTNAENALPAFPNGVRVTYPFTGSGVLLPLSPQNGYTPEVLVCGGTNLDDRLPVSSLRVSDPASAQCARMVLTDSGIQAGWKIEQMPSPRIMPDLIILPDGKVMIVNGAKTGVAGYGNLVDKVGNSNADNPSLTPVLYDPAVPAGQRFSSVGLPTSTIPRLYHSVATLVPSGNIMIAGSNPNKDVSTAKYPTEYRVEWLSPPYLNDPSRPVISEAPSIANYKEQITVKLAGTEKNLTNQGVEAVLLDLGFVTHSVHMNSRLVKLHATLGPDNNNALQIVIPPSPEIYPPGYAWLHVLVNGIPSPGKKIMIGSGKLNL
ncbi:hypothetical protein PCASD_24199 [Puccinia coronata f. sp. avenae]|uniref:Galactose oxidase-like Early set domain-containing protein n=1 Tax=Puccinia coronata f. sp. avenae TaxID=200324 RepID=A0A2N5SFR2_9BASI|nr:hypothetical protein PCASD_24199 [Puccinia coronata f. sp. avenae]